MNKKLFELQNKHKDLNDKSCEIEIYKKFDIYQFGKCNEAFEVKLSH